MYAKILTLGLLTGALAIQTAQQLLVRGPAAQQQVLRGPAAPAGKLVSAEAGPWQQTERWSTPLTLGAWQESARYRHESLQVVLSYDHYSSGAHNAIYCFAQRGDEVLSSSVQSFRTRDGSARFNVARLETAGDGAALVAAGLCGANGCTENEPPLDWANLLRLDMLGAHLQRLEVHGIPINVSILMDRAGAASEPEAFQRLEVALADFIGQLDLAPVRQQAAHESRQE